MTNKNLTPANKEDKTYELYHLPIINRVKELMREVGLGTGNIQLVLDIAVIYVQAQRDQIKSQLENV